MPPRVLNGSGLGVFAHRDSRKSKAQVALKDAAASVLSDREVARRPMVENLEARQMLSNTWFVAPYGSNSNAGSLGAPFQTIQQAANVAEPGDHVEIRAGVYHETVTPAHSGAPGAPITYEAYNGENVTISGADPVTGWSNYSGGIYSAPMSWDLGEGNNEIFVNGQGLNEAMFPNTAVGNISHPSTLTMTGASVHGNSAVIYSSSLNQPANTWKGAVIHMNDGQAWEDQTGTVTSSSPGSVTISFLNDGAYHTPVPGNQFYLFGKFQALDTAGEWYRDPSTGRLYAWMPNSGNAGSVDVEAKHRQYAFNLNNVSNTTIHGLTVFAAAITTSGKSSGTVINGVTSLYGAQQMQIPEGWYVPPVNQAVEIMGGSSVVENSTVAFASGAGIVIGAGGDIVQNNVIHDVAYTGANTAGVVTVAGNVTISHNTIYNSGRHGILAEEPKVNITYNIIHDVGLQTTEAGGIYTANTNGQGAIMAYNEIYNIHTGGFGGTALFTDNYSSNWVVHNNITWNVDYGLKMNYVSNNNIIYNNTIGASKLAINTNQQGNWYGVKIYNNIFEAGVVLTHGADVYNNAYSAGSANSSEGAGSFGAGASGVVSVTPPVTTPPVTTPPVTTPPTTTPLATSKVMAVNDTKVLGLLGDNFTGLGYAYNNDWASYQLDFGTGGLKTFTAGIAAVNAGGSIEIHLGSPSGTLLGTLNTALTGSWGNYTAQSTGVSNVTGVQTIYLVFKGPVPGVANLDWLQFS